VTDTTETAPANPIAGIDAAIATTSTAASALADKKAAVTREIRAKLAEGDDVGAKALRAEMAKIAAQLTTEADRLAGLKERKALAVADAACAEADAALRAARDISAKRVALAARIDKAVATLGDDVAALVELSRDLDRMTQSSPHGVRTRGSTDDVFHGLSASLIRAGLTYLFPQYQRGAGDIRRLSTRIDVADAGIRASQ
jgi:hypothetical protein